jgi:UDP-N-acetylglucosamine/UDP-N-acetylgalactosamine 4-epimerase
LETLIKNFIKESTFLVTGGAGFIGSNLCEFLTLNQAKKVICLDNLFNSNQDNIKELLTKPNFEFVIGDINDLNLLNRLTKDIDFVLHQAAWGSVPRSMTMPFEYHLNNVDGTLNIFESARINKVKKVVYASSSSVYGDHPSLPKVEGIEGNILSPYALTKSINEKHGKLYWDVYKVPTIGLRYFNVFGRKQNPQGEYAAVIPRFISKIINNQPIQVFGDGDQSRDFTYIDNVIEANLKACFFSKQESYGKSFNIAFGEKVTINELIDKIKKELKTNAKVVFSNDRLGDIKHSMADITLAKKHFSYSPTFDFSKGMEMYIEWYKKQT